MDKGKIIATALLFTCILSFGNGFAGNKDHTVAVFNLNADSQPLSETGRDISSLISVKLSQNKNIQIVEREKIVDILSEIGLSLSGIVDEKQALRAGKLTGAKILVTGRLFLSGNDISATVKIIGTETSRVKYVMASASPKEAVSALSKELAEKIGRVIEKDGDSLVAQQEKKEDVLNALMDKLHDKQLPSVTIFANEQHMKRAISDPAVETELVYFMEKCGFEIKEEPLPAGNTEFFRKKQYLDMADYTADIIIVSEAVSEFAGQRGELVSCRGRVEIRAIDRKSKRVLAVGKSTRTNVGISETIVAKTVLEETAEEIISRFIPEMVKKWEISSKQ